MDRRRFLRAAFVATAGGILVARDLISTKTYFLPPAGGWPHDWRWRNADVWVGVDDSPYAAFNGIYEAFTYLQSRIPDAKFGVHINMAL